METGLVVVFVGLLVFLAHFFVTLFERTRVPDVLYLALIGIVIGPVLGIVSPDDFGKIGPIFTTIALVVILFEGGLELSIESLQSSFRGTILITVLSYLVGLLLITGAAYFLADLTLQTSLFVGAVLAGPAPSIVIPLVRQIRLTNNGKTMLTLEASFGEALCIVVSLAVLESFKLEQIQVGHFIGRLLSSFLFAVMIGVAGGYVWSLLLQRMRQLRHSIFTTPSFVFIVFGVSEFLGFSGPVAALMVGITLGNIDRIQIRWIMNRYKFVPMRHNEVEKAFFGEIVFVLKTFFFIYIGLSVRFVDVASVGMAFALTGVLLLARYGALQVSTRLKASSREDLLPMAVIIPKGTAAAVLAGIPIQMEIAGGALIQNLTYGVVIFSIVLTSVLIFILEKTNPPVPSAAAVPSPNLETMENGRTEPGTSRYV